jgi:hypothetical protein
MTVPSSTSSPVDPAISRLVQLGRSLPADRAADAGAETAAGLGAGTVLPSQYTTAHTRRFRRTCAED